MYFLRGPEEGLQDIIALSAPYLESRENLSLPSLKAAYQVYLSKQQPEVPAKFVQHAEFTRDRIWRSELSGWFRSPESRNKTGNSLIASGETDQAIDEVLQGFRVLCQAEPELAPLFDLAVNHVFVMTEPQEPGSGSSFDGVGLVYVNPQVTWTTQDAVECLTHEFAHTLLYLDAMRHTHHPDYRLLDMPENEAETAITGRRRSIFFAFQSFLIAAEILTVRKRHPNICPGVGIHGSTVDILKTAKNTYDRCMRHPNLDTLASPRLKGLLADAHTRMHEIEQAL
ncbi:HEXXH motif-containing putative peptide modification protein [Streptomyces sp. SID12501]|uniref:HEXXH motif domain-containing protein n=1 Tax=Streptomyces sp. SID12501 TaxID=2706042 RepID=A0A6B3BPG2_9ACTN|nr:HEXXH motif-containing putative peptide modification protein [Streptomyces sp. SID12501]NEC86242.1 hypothetical protein [Streptomyces sp. SID12501]